MASDRSYRQLRNIQDEDISDEESSAFAPLRQSSGGVDTKYRGPRSQPVSASSCGKGRATCIIFVVLIFVLAIAVVSSFARPRCSREADTTTNIYTTVPQHTQNTPTPTSVVYPWGNIRLPTEVKPVEYDIFLHPNLTTYNVTGSVQIQAKIVNPPTSLIVLHSRNMTLEDVRVMDSAGANIPIRKLLCNKKFEQIIIVLKNEIKVTSTVKIMINFTYELQAVLQGFYRSTYKDSEGATKTIATTQFEPSDARAAFPCFDEPSLKAKFSLKMVRDPDYHTLFNMPLDHTETYDDLQMDVFQKSLKMSTYLVAFVVSEFKNQTYQIRDNLEVGVHAPARQITEMDLALKILNKTIQFYEKFFNVPYPLPKQDMVAIPDFAAGAMENWGLITYRQVEVLYKPGSTTLRQEQRVSIVITHELAHQWFGNLVTMKWWNDLWLNEGFASFVEYIGTDNWNKEWHMMDQFILQSTHSAMAMDCLESSHPISVKVNAPEEISAVFDAISYDKGASIIRMLQEYLGNDVFLTGLNNYLNKHAYSNAESDDLWKALDQEDEGIVKKMMDTWTLQKGYPVVTMSRNSDIIEVSQKQFFLKENFRTEEGSLWVIPLTYVFDNRHNYSVLLQNDNNGTNLTIDKSARWFKGNIGQTGFYRVNYDDQNWIALSEQLNKNHKVFDPADRASLIDDANYLARAGLLNYSIALELTGYIAEEEDYVPIVTALGHLGYIGMMLQKTGDYISYKNYMRKLAKTWKSNLTWEESESDPHLTKFLRDSVLTLAIDLGDDDTIKEAIEIFRNWKDNNGTINENLKYPVYCAAARNGLRSEWEFLWNRYLTTEVVSEKNVVMAALACTTDISTIYWYLDSMFSGNVRLQDIGGVMSSIAGQPQGAEPAWQFLMENWDKFLSKLGSTSFSLGNIITSCTASIASPIEYEQAKMFFAARSNAGSGTRAVVRAIERMDINVKWLQKNRGTIKKWLSNQT